MFKDLATEKCFDDYKKRKNMIKRKIDSLLECLERDSEEEI
jgi:hypothetical protein